MASDAGKVWDVLYREGYGALRLPPFFLEGPFPRGGRVLDVGCGDGAHLRDLADRFGVEGVGIDPALEALRRSLAGSGEPRVALLAGIGERLPFADGTFDAVFSFGVIEHTRETERAVAESFRVLKPGGWAYHSVPHVWSCWTLFVRPLKKLLGRWRLGLERSFTAGGFSRMFRRAGFAGIEVRKHGFDSYDCYLAARPLAALYRIEDRIRRRVGGVGFFLHVRGRKPAEVGDGPAD